MILKSHAFLIWSKVYWSLWGLYLIIALPFAMLSMANEMTFGLFFGLIAYAVYTTGIFAGIGFVLLSVPVLIGIKVKSVLDTR